MDDGTAALRQTQDRHTIVQIGASEYSTRWHRIREWGDVGQPQRPALGGQRLGQHPAQIAGSTCQQDGFGWGVGHGMVSTAKQENIMRAIVDLAQSLADGRTTSRALVEEALSRIADPSGEGS